MLTSIIKVCNLTIKIWSVPNFFINIVSLEVSRTFLTIPRYLNGVPITLGYIKSPSTDNLIQPYPDYSWHSSNGANCDGFTSVFRVAIDKCHQLWVLDS